jgi:fructokinase
VIAVAGEALMDLVIDASGSVLAVPGGGPFNAARMVARLGTRCRFLGRLSDDGLGARLRAALQADGVEVVAGDPVDAPTTLAIAEVDAAGVARYRFYCDATSAGQLRPGDLPEAIHAGVDAWLVGGLGLVLEPMATTLLELMSDVPPHVVVMVDPNCRPTAIADPAAYRRRLAEFLRRADVVKVSTEDLGFLDPGVPPSAAAHALLAHGPRTVLVTDGAGPVAVHTSSGMLSVPVPRVPVVDTVGAGDAFAAGFLARWVDRPWTREDLTDPERLLEATAAAVEVAAAPGAARSPVSPACRRASLRARCRPDLPARSPARLPDLAASSQRRCSAAAPFAPRSRRGGYSCPHR